MSFCFVVAPLTVRKRSEYENMDNDIVQGDEDHHNDDEDGETGEERLPVKQNKILDEQSEQFIIASS